MIRLLQRRNNLALSPGTRAISKSTHFGSLCARGCSDQLNSGDLTISEDDYDEQIKTTDWWGYIWPKAYNINQVVYTTGTMFPNGGWYQAKLRVQVRHNFQWVDVPGATVTPAYPYTADAGNFTSYTFNLPNTWGDGVRIIGHLEAQATSLRSVSWVSTFKRKLHRSSPRDVGRHSLKSQETSTVKSWLTEVALRGPAEQGLEKRPSSDCDSYFPM